MISVVVGRWDTVTIYKNYNGENIVKNSLNVFFQMFTWICGRICSFFLIFLSYV